MNEKRRQTRRLYRDGKAVTTHTHTHTHTMPSARNQWMIYTAAAAAGWLAACLSCPPPTSFDANGSLRSHGLRACISDIIDVAIIKHALNLRSQYRCSWQGIYGQQEDDAALPQYDHIGLVQTSKVFNLFLKSMCTIKSYSILHKAIPRFQMHRASRTRRRIWLFANFLPYYDPVYGTNIKNTAIRPSVCSVPLHVAQQRCT